MQSTAVLDEAEVEDEDAPGAERGVLRVIWTSAVDHQQLVIGTVAILAALAAWEICASTHVVNPAITSSPSRVARGLVKFIGSQQGRHDIAISAKEYFIGVILALLVGIPLGIVAGWFKYVSALIQPFLTFLNSVPLIAFVPLMVLWFGLGLTSKVVIVFLVCILPVTITCMSGVKTVESHLVDVARVFGARDIQVLWTLVLPGSIPAIAAGVRLSVGFGLIGVVVGEIVASTAGLGYVISVAGNSFDADQLFVAVTIIAAAGLIFTAIVRRLERRVDRWRVA